MSQYCNMITKTSSLDAAGRRKEQISAKRQRSTAWKSELAEINAKARQEGMSYGQYVGLMYCEERDEMERRRRYDRKRRERFG